LLDILLPLSAVVNLYNLMTIIIHTLLCFILFYKFTSNTQVFNYTLHTFFLKIKYRLKLPNVISLVWSFFIHIGTKNIHQCCNKHTSVNSNNEQNYTQWTMCVLFNYFRRSYQHTWQHIIKLDNLEYKALTRNIFQHFL